MADVAKREQKSIAPTNVFDRMFDDWMTVMPFRRPWLLGPDLMSDDVIKVDEYNDGNDLVIRAEMAGIDPDKDVELTVNNGMLNIQAERREEERKEQKGYRRHELRYGSFSRSLPLPTGVKESDISASYQNGILEIRVPAPKESATRVPIAKK